MGDETIHAKNKQSIRKPTKCCACGRFVRADRVLRTQNDGHLCCSHCASRPGKPQGGTAKRKRGNNPWEHLAEIRTLTGKLRTVTDKMFTHASSEIIGAMRKQTHNKQTQTDMSMLRENVDTATGLCDDLCAMPTSPNGHICSLFDGMSRMNW